MPSKLSNNMLGILYIIQNSFLLPQGIHKCFSLFSPASEQLLNLGFLCQIFHQIVSCRKSIFSHYFHCAGSVMILSDEGIFQLPWIFFLLNPFYSAFSSKIHSCRLEHPKCVSFNNVMCCNLSRIPPQAFSSDCHVHGKKGKPKNLV